MSSNRKLWKVISLSKTRGNRISKSVGYGEAHTKFQEYRKDLLEGDTLYMIQVLEVAVGREAINVSDEEEIVIGAPVGFAFDQIRGLS